MDRPFLTFDEQVDRLIGDRGLIIEDRQYAIEILSSVSYYDLVNGYQDMFMVGDKYKDGIRLEFLLAMHIFNKNIQSILFKYVTYSENSFKTILSYVVSRSFSENEDDYLNKANYRRPNDPYQRKRFHKTLDSIKKICNNTSHTPTSHYRRTKNHIPPWILLRNVSFSNATNWYSFLRTREKTEVLKYFKHLNNNSISHSDKVKILQNSLTVCRIFRNKIAHNLNFMGYRGSSLHKSANTIFENTLINEDELDITRRDVWAMVISVVILLNNDILEYNFLTEFNSYMEADHMITELYCEFAGIPTDFRKRIESYLTQLNDRQF